MVVVMFIIDQQPAAQFDVHGVHLPDKKKEKNCYAHWKIIIPRQNLSQMTLNKFLVFHFLQQLKKKMEKIIFKKKHNNIQLNRDYPNTNIRI